MRRWPLPQLDSFYQRMREAAADHVYCVHFDHGVSDGDQICDCLKIQRSLHLQEGVHFPRVAVAGECVLVCTAGRDDLDMFADEQLFDCGHAKPGRMLHPALRRVGDDHYLSGLAGEGEQSYANSLESFELLLCGRGDASEVLHHELDVCSGHQRVVPVKDGDGLRRLGPRELRDERAAGSQLLDVRKPKVVRRGGRDGACASECAMTSTSSSEYASSEAGAPSANGAAASSSRFVMPTFIK
eukprot:CAMPEP_0179970258 /NCGR_PEP_ID=MMETSP0983-20121128/35175_1 /TAXON_ID=483367 /ORGANISM="non described non described, Strain CCMP 2436" /LENGTH=241 /DNA_ID=CAMNT_0021884857 /DNA_START=732 /DNA_END=1458 /DNA_ORIENTATION=-